ncbi:MAG: RluA family pseudouridine synthase [Negativicutes bacterium]|jgi:23S rRNA pseudouridine1911/1915/1917 synthase
MKTLSLIVTDADSDKRVDVYLTEQLCNLSRTRVQSLCKSGDITVNGKVPKSNQRIAGGDQLIVNIPAAVTVEILAEAIPLDVVYEDEHLAVINKAPGMVVHPAVGNYTGTLVNAIMARMDDLSGIGGEIRPGIVHRLDKDTSGLIVVAKNDNAHKILAAAIAEHQVARKYLAVVKGAIAENQAIIRTKIGRHSSDRKKMAVVEKNGKNAETEFFVRERFKDLTLVECHLRTGRTHQIRVHMAYIGHPILGDGVYGNAKNRFDFRRQALHAFELSFTHPVSGESMTFNAPLWPDMQELLEKIMIHSDD